MNKSDEINELAKALAEAQAEIENASKNSNNPHFKSKYADLAEVINTVRPVFSKHGLSVSQFPSFADGLASVETVLMHSSGQWMSGIASAGVTKQDAQGVGSAITYLRRYSLAAVAGIAQEDDDANAAVGGHSKTKVQPVKITPTTGAWESMTPDQQTALTDIAMEVIAKLGGLTSDEAEDAYQYIEHQNLSHEEKIALWTRFDSKQRSALKKAAESLKATKEQAA